MIAKYRKAEYPGEWWLTDFTMEQVEGRINNLETALASAQEREQKLDEHFKLQVEGYMEKINELEEREERERSLIKELNELNYWKSEQLLVENTWDVQAVGKLIGCKWGESIREKIEPFIKNIQERERVLRKALEQLSKPLSCGCMPCTGDCRSKTALEAELEGRIDFARAALERKEG